MSTKAAYRRLKMSRVGVQIDYSGDWTPSRRNARPLPSEEIRRKPKVPAKVAAEWRAKLAASGFQDLERATDQDGPLSNRGNLHESGEEDAPPLLERIEDGTVYLAWAQDILPRLTGCSAAAKRRRRMWELHASGESLKEISRTMGATFWSVRETIMKIQAKYKRESAEPRTRGELRKMVARSVRSVSTKTLADLAQAMILVERRRAHE
jgi:hypothetical protein